MPRGKSLSPEQNERVREVVRTLLPAHDGVITALAKELGVTQAALSAFLSGKNGAGFQLAGNVATRVGTTLDQLIGGDAPGDDEGPMVQNLTGWAEAEAQARSVTNYEDWLWRFVRTRRKLAPANGAPVTAEWALELAAFHNRNAALEAKAAADTAKVKASIKGLRTRKANDAARKTAKE